MTKDEPKPMENTIQIPNPYPDKAWSVDIDKRRQRVRFTNEDEDWVRLIVEPREPKGDE